MLGVVQVPSSEKATDQIAHASMQPTETPSIPIGQPTEKSRMIQFTSPDCSICRQMIPKMALLAHDCRGKQVELLKVNVKQQPELARNYRIQGVPTFVFLEATLAFLGVSDPLLPTWGKLIVAALSYGVNTGATHIVIAPLAVLFLTGFAFAMVGISLERVFEPRLRER